MTALSQVVLITGVSRFLGCRLAAQLEADPRIERIIGVDTVPPRAADLPLLGRTEFVRADIRNPLIAKVITQARVTTVVHAALVGSTRAVGGRTSMQEMNVIGTMQLLAACQRSEDVSRVVLKSTTAVYGCGPRDPAVFTEDMSAVEGVDWGFAKDAIEVESYVRGFARRRPDVGVSVLRFADIVGPSIDTALTRYLSPVVVPAVAGYDPRLQLLHESDAVEVLRLATVSPRPGTVNVAASGVLPLSQALRRTGKVRMPVPRAALGLSGLVTRNAGAVELGTAVTRYLTYGRVVDVTRLHGGFGYVPSYDTAAALDTLVARRAAPGRLALAGLSVGSRVLQARRERRIAVTGA